MKVSRENLMCLRFVLIVLVVDDIAISEAIAQIEKELKGKQPELPENLKTAEQTTQTTVDEKQEGPFSLVAIILFIVIGALTAKFALKLF